MGRRREFNEAEVVEQAMDLFWRQGFRNTSPQNLVDATGLSKSSLYATFDNKKGLFLAALDRYVQSQVEQMRAMTATGNLRTNLEQLYAALIMLATTPDNARTCLVCSSTIEAPLEDLEVAELVRAGHEAIESVLHEMLVRAQESGELAADRDPESLARFILNNNMGLMVVARTHPDPVRLQSIAAEVIRAIC